MKKIIQTENPTVDVEGVSYSQKPHDTSTDKFQHQSWISSFLYSIASKPYNDSQMLKQFESRGYKPGE